MVRSRYFFLAGGTPSSSALSTPIPPSYKSPSLTLSTTTYPPPPGALDGLNEYYKQAEKELIPDTRTFQRGTTSGGHTVWHNGLCCQGAVTYFLRKLCHLRQPLHRHYAIATASPAPAEPCLRGQEPHRIFTTSPSYPHMPGSILEIQRREHDWTQLAHFRRTPCPARRRYILCNSHLERQTKGA